MKFKLIQSSLLRAMLLPVIACIVTWPQNESTNQ